MTDLSPAARLNLFALRVARNWLRILLTFLGIYVALPYIAPTLMKVGLEAPARAIYTIYRPFCHQFGFRTFYLYGEQAAYPLAGAETTLRPFEAYAGRSRIVDDLLANRIPQPPFNVAGLPDFYGIDIPERFETENASPSDDVNFGRFQLAASAFLGNEQMGYKMPLCERDISIYTALFGVALIYSRPFVRRRLRPVPLLLFVLLGVAPIGIDGFSQLLGYPPFSLWQPRETLPLFRVLTGVLFGGMTAWLGLPYIEMSMQGTAREIAAKFRAAGIEV